MKTKLLPFLFCFILTNTYYSQIEKAKIVEIDKLVTATKNNLNTFQKVEKINTKESTRFLFVKKDDLKLIIVKGIESDIEKNVEWFYFNGFLTYCETNWFNISSHKNIFSEKCYLDKGHLIAWIDSKINM